MLTNRAFSNIHGGDQTRRFPANATIRPTDADAPVTAWPAELDTPFMRFWRDLNKTFEAHKLPEVLYGEARDLYGRRTWDNWPGSICVRADGTVDVV